MWQWLACLLGKHDWVPVFERTTPGRFYLQCVHCPKHTAGISIADRPPRRVA
jgi:hypothetical protein